MKPGRFFVIVLVVSVLCFGMVFSAGAAGYKTYTVKSGDTLWGIAKRFYGKQDLWPKLWEMNRYNTTNPHHISVGDVLTIYPIEQLMQRQSPPQPPPLKESLYDRGRPLDVEYPRYFTFVADPDGIAGTGVHRIKVKKVDLVTGKTIITYDEVRQVGEVIASMERGFKPGDTGGEIHGRLLLSFNDDVIIRFTQDLAKILDSATHEDPDPYFREYAIYGMGEEIREPGKDRHDYRNIVGRLHEYKGKLTVVARVETLAPITEEQEAALGSQPGRNRNSEPVSYVAKITESEKDINIGDLIFLFKSLSPGPDRIPGGKKLHNAGQYKATAP